ncbi:MAG: hypothetical protein KIT86_17170 [Hydrogenophaga sp.]|uniref:hypothetical protein n=1 Tax=Hydrogenophaga sp. TaxID=1904254 RepID=UPI002602C905|nr:hypothetical protein [Hydrogenophaga sp.]MCW5671388.1 hypothetical protein [Hydrogenophaga sp.]
MRDLLRQLPRLRSDRQGNVDYANSHRVIVAETGQNAERIARAQHMGMGAIGHLLATSAPQIEDGSVDSDAIEALGWLMAELGDLGAELAVMAVMAIRCRARDRPP